MFEFVVVVIQCASYKPYATVFTWKFIVHLDQPRRQVLCRYVQLCECIVGYSYYLAKEYHKENISITCIVLSLLLLLFQFKPLRPVVTMALKYLYRIYVI